MIPVSFRKSPFSVNVFHLIPPIVLPELIRMLCLCGQSVYSILNKKIITKSLLFEYLSQYKPCPGSSTKTDLIEKIVQFWKDKYKAPVIDAISIPTPPPSNVVINIVNNHTINNTIVQQPTEPSPLQRMSEEFTSWLFQRINNTSLVESDLWKDVTNAIRLIDSSGNTQDLQSEGSESVLQSFQHLRGEFKFQLAPNICPTGVQGKMNPYGMVMIASCGTVYQEDQFVGVFEAGFGLLRDPNSSDLWKLKHSKVQIKSAVGIATAPQLEDCDSLKEILALPEPDENQKSLIKYEE